MYMVYAKVIASIIDRLHGLHSKNSLHLAGGGGSGCEGDVFVS